jgi:hypothetical protein
MMNQYKPLSKLYVSHAHGILPKQIEIEGSIEGVMIQEKRGIFS